MMPFQPMDGVRSTALPDVVITRIASIELLLLDVDGVLTDGSVIYGDPIVELKRFHVRDGSGLKLWRMAGKQAALISGRSSPAVDVRAMELGISPVLQGRSDKMPALREILQVTGLKPEQIAVMGDDIPDLPLFLNLGIGIAVADACAELRGVADYVTTVNGGRGAVREAIEWLLKAMNRWDSLIEPFYRAKLSDEEILRA